MVRLFLLISLLAVVARAANAQWVHVISTQNIYGLDTDPEGRYLYAHEPNCILRSSDLGTTWDTLPIQPANLIFYDSGRVIAGIPNGKIFSSFDYGTHWDSVGDGMTKYGITALCRAGGLLIAGTSAYGFFLSKDTGSTWFSINKGLELWMDLPLDSGMSWEVASLAYNDGYIFAGTYRMMEGGEGIFRSRIDTIMWENVDPNFSGGNVLAFSQIGSVMFAAGFNFDEGFGGIHSSLDSGNSWINFSPASPNQEVASLCYSPPYLFAGHRSTGVFFSGDSGHKWHQAAGLLLSQPPTYDEVDVTSLAATHGFVFAGISSNRTDSNGLWRRPISDLEEVGTVLEPNSTEIGVLPNPTTGVVTISGVSGAVSVENVLGESVMRNACRVMRNGSISLDVSSEPAGTYFVQAATPSGLVVRKIVKE